MGMISLGGASYDLTANSAPLIQEMAKAEAASKKSVEAISKATGVLEKDVARLANTYLREEKRRADASAQATLRIIKSYNDAGDAAEKAAAKATKAGDQSSVAFLGAAKGAGAFAAAAIGVQVGADTINKALTSVVESTKKVEQAQFAVNKLYAGGAADISKFATDLATSSGRSRAEALEAAAAVANLGRQYALTSQQQKQVLQISADVAAIRGISMAAASEKVAGALRGEAEAAEYLGQVLNSDAVKAMADMTDEQRKHFEALQPATKAQIVLGKLVKDNADLTGTAAERAKTFGGSLDRLAAANENIAAAIGEKLIPVVVPLVQSLADAAEATDKWVKAWDVQYLGQVAEVLAGIASFDFDRVAKAYQANAAMLEQRASGADRLFGPTPEEIRDANALYDQYLNRQKDALIEFVAERKKAISTVAEAQEKAARDEAKQTEAAIEREKIRLEVEQEGRLKALDERQRSTIAAIEAEADAAKKASEENIARAEREKDSKLAAVDEAHDRVVAAIKVEQDALDAAREIEDRAREDARRAYDQDLADFRARQDAEVQATADALQKRRALEDQARADRRAAEDQDRQDRRAADDQARADRRADEDREVQEMREREDRKLAFALQVIALRREMENRAIAARREAEDRDLAARRRHEERELADARAAEDAQLERSHEEALARLEVEHEAALKGLEDEAEAARRAHDDRMRDLNRQARAEDDRHRQAMRAIQSEADAKLRAIDEELGRLDAADDADANAARDRQLQDAITNARFGLKRAESTGNQSEIVKAQQELDDALAAITREGVKRERDAARDTLRARQQTIKDQLSADQDAERERNRLHEQEIEDAQAAARTILEGTLAAIKTRVDAEKLAHDGRLAQLKSEFDAEKERIAARRLEEDRDREDRLLAEDHARADRRLKEDQERADRLTAEDKQLEEHRQRIADRRRAEDDDRADRRLKDDRDRSDRRRDEDREISESRQAQDRRRQEERTAEDNRFKEDGDRLRLRRQDEDRAIDARRLAEDRAREDYRKAEDKKLTDQLAAAKATQMVERAAINEHYNGPNGVLNQIRQAMEHAQTEYQNRLNDAKRKFEEERAEIRAIYRNTARTGLLDLQDEAARNNKERLGDQLTDIQNWKNQANEFIEDNKGKWKDLTEAINATGAAIRNLPQTTISVPRPPSSGGSSPGGSAPGAPPSGSIPGPDPGMPGGTNPGPGGSVPGPDPGMPGGTNPGPGQPPASSVPGPGGPWGVTFPFNAPYNPDGVTPAWPGGPSHHRGVDLKLPGPDNGHGTTFGAFDGGRIVQATSEGAGGKGVIIAADSGKYNYYGHLDRLLKSSGRIEKGEPLGTLGRTGLEPGIQTHLHYEVRRGINGDPVGQLTDPMPYVRGMANGGVIREPIYGIGASGQRYAFGENAPREPELVTPLRYPAAGLGAVPGAQFTMPDVAGQVAASAQLALSAAAASSPNVIHHQPIYLGGQLLADLWIGGKQQAATLGRHSETRSSYKTGGPR